jgi:4-amino-4-deoxy-L-arabinose transferase-like glycosyltransferase
MLALTAATSAILIAAIIFASLLPPRGVIAALVAVGLIAASLVITTLGIAGLAIRDLSGSVLVALSVGWLAVAIALGWRAGMSLGSVGTRVRGALATTVDAMREPAVAISGMLIGATLVWRFLLAARLPIVDYDGWSYHLVFVDVWLQHNALTLVPQRPWTAGYPADSELIATWFAAFTRTDALTGYSSLAPIPLAMAATAGLARSFGTGRRFALLAGFLFGMTPAVIALAGTTYVDNLSVAAVAAAWWLGLRIVRGERAWSTALLLGIAAGLAIGTKGTNVVLAGPATVAAIGVLVLSPPGARAASFRRAGVYLLAVGVPVVALGAVWYLKNLAVYGNPLYPFAVGPFSGPTTLSEFTFTPPQLEGLGLPAQLLSSWIADWRLDQYVYNIRPGGLGRAWPLILVMALAGVALLIRQRAWAPLVLVVLPAVLTLATMPMPWYARLTLYVPAVAIPLAVVALEALGRLAGPGRVAASVGAIILVGVAALSLAFANIRPNIDVRDAIANHRQPVGRAYLAYVLEPSDARRDEVSLRADCAGFRVIPRGARVAPTGFNLLHGIAGPEFDRILTDPIPVLADASALIDAMHARGAGWLVTDDGGPLDALAASRPDAFEPQGRTCLTARVWRLLPGS